jgi:hypothetical protein
MWTMRLPPNFATRRVVLGSCCGLAAGVAAALAIELARGHALGQQVVLASRAASAPADDDELVPACKTNIRLSGAVYDTARPERSLALFKLATNQRAGVYRAGMWVGSYELVAIEPRGVLLRNADGECWLRLVGDPDRARSVKAPPPRPKPRKPKK